MFLKLTPKNSYKKALIALLLLFVICYSQQTVQSNELMADKTSFKTINCDKETVDINENNILSVNDILQLAYNNNNSYNISKKDTQIFKLEAKKSLLDFLPSLGTSMTYTYNTNTTYLQNQGALIIPSIGPVDISGFETDKKWQRNNSVYINQPISMLIKTYHRSKIADADFKNSILDNQKQQDDLYITIYETILNLSLIKSQIEASKSNIESLEFQYNMALERYNQGTSLLRDAQKVEVELERAKYNKIASENDYSNTLNDLKYLAGIPIEQQITVNTDINLTFNPQDYTDSLKQMLDTNKEISKAQNKIIKTQQAKKELYANYIPDISINANYTNQSGSAFLPKNNLAMLFDMKFEFFDWTKREKSIKQKQFEVEKSVLEKKDIIDNLKLTLNKTLKEIDQYQKLIETEQKSIDLSKSNLEYSLNRYKVGFALISDVLSDQNEVYNSMVRYNEANFIKQKAILKYQNLVGLLKHPNEE